MLGVRLGKRSTELHWRLEYLAFGAVWSMWGSRCALKGLM